MFSAWQSAKTGWIDFLLARARNDEKQTIRQISVSLNLARNNYSTQHFNPSFKIDYRRCTKSDWRTLIIPLFFSIVTPNSKTSINWTNSSIETWISTSKPPFGYEVHLTAICKLALFQEFSTHRFFSFFPQVCRQASYFKHALVLAEKHQKHEWYLRIQLEDVLDYQKVGACSLVISLRGFVFTLKVEENVIVSWL